jgi:hypothetical protein
MNPETTLNYTLHPASSVLKLAQQLPERGKLVQFRLYAVLMASLVISLANDAHLNTECTPCRANRENNR